MVFPTSGVVLVCAGWVCAVSSILVLARFGEWRKGAAALFLGKSERELGLSVHLTHRSLGAMALYASVLFFDFSVTRSVAMQLFAIRDRRSHHTEVRLAICLMALTYFCISSITLVRAWRVRMRHMYYVVLRNSAWSKLMDPSLEESLSFWVKYKAMFTSDCGMLALVCTWVLLGVAICISLYNSLRTLRIVASVLMISMSFVSILLVFNFPECECLLRREILSLATLNLLGLLLNVIASIVVKTDRVSFLMGQCIATVMSCSLFFVAFVWTPLRFVQANDNDNYEKLPNISSDKLHIVLSDVSQLSKFMQYCCDHFCAENLLALLEIKEYKRTLRKQLSKELKRAEKEKSGTPLPKSPFAELADNIILSTAANSLTTPTPTGRTPTPTSKSGIGNESLFSRAEVTDLQLSAHIDERWTRWDLSGFVRLSALGCRSAIVSGAGDARSKALSLCQKYFEWDSEFSLNISYQNRSKVLALVGKDSAVALEPVALLYVFDEAMCDVFDNLNDPLIPFLKQQS